MAAETGSKGPRLLITGCRGQVGTELVRSLAPLGQVIALDRSRADLTDPAGLRCLLDDLRPDVILNAAAYTAVDSAEDEEELAYAVNGTAPAVLAAAAARQGSLLVHYSTDYVFDGSGSTPWREEDVPAPRSVYGRSKLAGEQAVQASGARYFIFRTCWVYADHGHNFLKTILRLAGDGPALKVVSDQTGSPTPAALVAAVTAQVLAQVLAAPERAAFGLYHLAAGGYTSWHGFAVEILRQAQALGMGLQAGPQDVTAIRTDDFQLAAVRPANSRLDTTRLRQTFGLTLPDWQAGIAPVLDRLRAGVASQERIEA
jgi:dTDP-4-dehydrorhamnose reductase